LTTSCPSDFVHPSLTCCVVCRGFREFGSSQKMPVLPPSSKRDRSGSNLSNTDANAAALIAAHLSVTEGGASTPGGSAPAGAHFSAGSHAGAQSSSSSIPLGKVLRTLDVRCALCVGCGAAPRIMSEFSLCA
jgi:hypothetical protein